MGFITAAMPVTPVKVIFQDQVVERGVLVTTGILFLLLSVESKGLQLPTVERGFLHASQALQFLMVVARVEARTG
jgi:hypothetical protein